MYYGSNLHLYVTYFEYYVNQTVFFLVYYCYHVYYFPVSKFVWCAKEKLTYLKTLSAFLLLFSQKVVISKNIAI